MRVILIRVYQYLELDEKARLVAQERLQGITVEQMIKEEREFTLDGNPFHGYEVY